MKKIISILCILLLFGVLFISGCGTPSEPTDQVNEQLGVDDINNDLNIVDADDEDFNLDDINIEDDLGDL